MAHKAKALVLSCMDFRFQDMIEKFIRDTEGLTGGYDRVAVAGAVKPIVRPAKPEFSEFVLEQIDLSVKLHTPDTIYLINHEDCGGYGAENGRDVHEKDLRDAKLMINKLYPDVNIRTFIATFDGIVEVK